MLAIPCNTSHFFCRSAPGRAAGPPFEHGAPLGGGHGGPGCRRVGILATDGTVRTGIYQRECAGQGVEAVVPGPQAQALTMSIIYDEIKRGESGSREKFAAIDQDLRSRGCDGAILACTELSVYKEYHGVSGCTWTRWTCWPRRASGPADIPLRSVWQEAKEGLAVRLLPVELRLLIGLEETDCAGVSVSRKACFKAAS